MSQPQPCTTNELQVLLGRCRDGDPTAPGELLERTNAIVLRAVGRRLNVAFRDLCELERPSDVTSELNLRILKYVRGQMGRVPATPGEYYALVNRIVFNLCIDHRRRYNQPHRRPGELPENQVADDEVLLLDHLGDLDPPDQELLNHKLQGLSAQEIASALGVSDKTVYKRLRALEARIEGWLAD